MTVADEGVDQSESVEEIVQPAPGRAMPWQRYLDAPLGLKNYWYPAFFSRELAEGETLAEEICGERIIFKRVDGEIHGVQDRCPHRGVAFSSRPECHSKNTLTCWFHGFTFDVRDGSLVQVITDPGSNLIGRLGVPSYQVREAFGLAWVFIGDELVPFEEDLPPVLQRALSGEQRRAFFPIARVRIPCDWRLAIENGMDPGHVYGHRDATVITRKPFPSPINGVPRGRIFTYDTTPGRAKHMVSHSWEWDHVWKVEIEGNVVEVDYDRERADEAPELDATTRRFDINVELAKEGGPTLPCLFIAAGFPDGKQTHLEWYVPVDETHHNYTILASLPVNSDEEEEAFYESCRGEWADLIWSRDDSVVGFNNYDAFGREQVAFGYDEEDFWHKEKLYAPDIYLTEWRMFVSREARGLVTRSGDMSPRCEPEASVVKYVH